MAKDKVIPPGIPAEEFPHAEEFVRDHENRLPEWHEVPGALKEVAEKHGMQKPAAPSAPKK